MNNFLFSLTRKNKNLEKLPNQKIYNKNFSFFCENFYTWKNNNFEFFFIGYISSIRIKDIQKKVKDISSIKRKLESPNNKSLFEGRFVLFKISKKRTFFEVWTDNYGRSDLYYYEKKNQIYLTDSLKYLTKFDNLAFNQLSLLHSLSIYGSRPPKKHVIYKKIKRLSGDQLLRYNNKISIIENKINLLTTNENFGKKELNDYYKYFIQSLKTKSSNNLNVILLSSGWDSTSILAGLKSFLPDKKIVAIIGRMKYAKRSGVINSFEIKRAKKMANYYGIKLLIVDFNYQNEIKFLTKDFLSHLKDNQFFSWTAINHWNLIRFAKNKFGTKIKLFAGEISDGLHNLGFSQYVTIFHPQSYEFREYSDKMNSYLFGPTFFKNILENKIKEDPVFEYFKFLNKNVIFEKLSKKNILRKYQILSNFFLRQGRLPFFSIKNSRIMKFEKAKMYLNEMEKEYFSKIINELRPNTIYSVYNYLYLNFHWQGSTVNTLENIANKFGLICELPFIDKNLVDLVSVMPEKFGRGLELNNTKFPLKWILKNKLDYPYEYQEGPHSYNYDIDRSFSHTNEVLYGSAFKTIFKKVLRKPFFVNSLDKKLFNVSYIRYLINGYLKNKIFKGQELADLFSIALHSLILNEK